MSKRITLSQKIGRIGETAVEKRFLEIGFQYDTRSSMEAGIDGIAEVMDDGKPLARMIAVQVKTTEAGRYTSETPDDFTYLLRSDDLEYWRPTNLPVIVVLHRLSDESFYWQEVSLGLGRDDRRLHFDKKRDVLNSSAVDRLAALTVPKAGFGYYIPPLGGGEQALVNILPLTLPPEIYVASTPHTGKKATTILVGENEPARFDWVINGGTFWSFQDPRQSACRCIVDLDQVEAIDTDELAFHEDEDQRNQFSYLLRQTLSHQVRRDLGWNKDRKLFYFRAEIENASRTFVYEATKKRAETDVVNAVRAKNDEGRVDFVRHHAFIPRFENLYDQWYLIINPTYFFTTNGYIPHSHPHALLAGKKRLDKSASLRGQIIMWHRFLTEADRNTSDLFATRSEERFLKFGAPPAVDLPARVPEDVWGSKKCVDEEEETTQAKLAFK